MIFILQRLDGRSQKCGFFNLFLALVVLKLKIFYLTSQLIWAGFLPIPLWPHSYITKLKYSENKFLVYSLPKAFRPTSPNSEIGAVVKLGTFCSDYIKLLEQDAQDLIVLILCWIFHKELRRFKQFYNQRGKNYSTSKVHVKNYKYLCRYDLQIWCKHLKLKEKYDWA